MTNTGAGRERIGADLTFWLANGVGAVGFALLAVAPLTGRRARFLVADMAGLAPVAAHYVLLHAPAGALMSVLYIVVDAAALANHAGRAPRGLELVFYPAAVALVVAGWRDVFDLAALAGAVLAITARQRRAYGLVLALVVASGACWLVYGIARASISQATFSTVYVAVSLAALWRRRRA